jgi:hypothetical protein
MVFVIKRVKGLEVRITLCGLFWAARESLENGRKKYTYNVPQDEENNDPGILA